MDEHVIREQRELIYEGSALDHYRDTMRLPDGSREYWDFLHHKRGGGAAVLPVLPDGRILMIRQRREAVDLEMLEIPAGARNTPEEDPCVTAQRELREETGYTCDKVTFLTRIMSAPAFLDEVTEIYLAEHLSREGERCLDPSEEITICPMELRDLLSMVYDGRICDGKTVAGILAYALKLKEEDSESETEDPTETGQ